MRQSRHNSFDLFLYSGTPLSLAQTVSLSSPTRGVISLGKQSALQVCTAEKELGCSDLNGVYVADWLAGGLLRRLDHLALELSEVCIQPKTYTSILIRLL